MLNPSLFQPALGSCCRSVWLPFLRVRHSLVFLLSCAFGDIASRLRAKGAEHKFHQTCHQQQPSPCCEDVLPAPVCLCLLRQCVGVFGHQVFWVWSLMYRLCVCLWQARKNAGNKMDNRPTRKLQMPSATHIMMSHVIGGNLACLMWMC